MFFHTYIAYRTKGMVIISFNAYLDEKELFFQYDDMLLGNRINCSFSITGLEQGNRYTDAMLNYCFEYYLNWSKTDLLQKLNKSYADRLLLWQFITKRIPCPGELDDTDLQYVAWHLHPRLRKISDEDLVIKVYMEVLTGKRDRFPKYFFDDTEGEKRAMICFRVMVNEYIQPECAEDLYKLFSCPEKSMAMLREYRLDVPAVTLFDSPYEYLSEVLIEDDVDEEYFYRKYNPLNNIEDDEDNNEDTNENNEETETKEGTKEEEEKVQ